MTEDGDARSLMGRVFLVAPERVFSKALGCFVVALVPINEVSIIITMLVILIGTKEAARSDRSGGNEPGNWGAATNRE